MKRPLIPDGKISRAIREGLLLRKQMIADGTPIEEVDRVVGVALKRAWQDSVKSDRTDPWRYYCSACKDTGWRHARPTYVEQQRLERLYGDDPQHQGYVVKCDPCPWMEMEREKRRKASGQETGLAAVGQVSRRKLSR